VSRALNRFMNRTAGAALAGVDVVVMVVDRGEWHDDDERVLQRCLRHRCAADPGH
jgi:GTP-binding protein Era